MIDLVKYYRIDAKNARNERDEVNSLTLGFCILIDENLDEYYDCSWVTMLNKLLKNLESYVSTDNMTD